MITKNARATHPLIPGRRPAQYIPTAPISNGKSRQGQAPLVQNDPSYQFPPIKLAQEVRDAVERWRGNEGEKEEGWEGASEVTRKLIRHWHNEDRENDNETPLYFAQLDAVLSHILVHECPAPYAQDIRDKLSRINDEHNRKIDRAAHKMATGTGKTLVMAMLILWQSANKQRQRLQGKREDEPDYADIFLCLTPGITVRERLEQALNPNGRNNDYQRFGIVPDDPEFREALKKANVKIANWHRLNPKSEEAWELSGAGKKVVRGGRRRRRNRRRSEKEESALIMMDRLGLGINDEKVYVINDEGHHCHPGDPKRKRPEESTIWHRSLAKIHGTGRLVKAVDLSATPVHLAQKDPSLFEWIISDYSLIDAMEAGLVKIPMTPPADKEELDPRLRDIYGNAAPPDEDAPRTKRSRGAPAGDQENTDPRKFKPDDPDNNRLLRDGLQLLYQHYEQTWRKWQSEGRTERPVMAIVMNDVENANAMYRHIADGTAQTEMFFNRPGEIPGTIVIHSKLEEEKDDSNKTMKENVKNLTDCYKNSGKYRFDPNARPPQILRRVLNTVGQPGEPGEHVRCIISVDMLTEGWDAKTVTHMLGYRAFGSALLSEQVAGRTLRRIDCDYGERTPPLETAYILGIPFPQFGDPGAVCPQCHQRECGCDEGGVNLPKLNVRNRERSEAFAVQWPNVESYSRNNRESRIKIRAKPTPDGVCRIPKTGQMLQTKMESTPGIEEHLQGRKRRDNRKQFLFEISAKAARSFGLEQQEQWNEEPAAMDEIFCQFLAAAKQHAANGYLPPETDGDYPGDEQSIEFAKNWLMRNTEQTVAAPGRSGSGMPLLSVVLQENKPRSSTSELAPYDTTDNGSRIYKNCRKAQANHAVCDSHWEVQTAHHLETMPEVARWARNHHLGWSIPYLLDGRQRRYYPDFVAVCPLPDGRELNIVIEVKGEEKPADLVKRRYAQEYWCPAVNRHPQQGLEQGKIWTYLYLPEQPMFENTQEKIREEIRHAAA